MQTTVYRRKPSAVSRGEREWRVEEDALVARSASGREKRYVWKDVVGVRLYCDPARYRPWRYVFEVHPRNGRRIEIDNASCVGVGAFEERSADYVAFVRAALSRLASENPRARALVGDTGKRYFFLLLAALVALGGLALALVAAPTPLDTLPYPGLIKLTIILLMLPIFWRWVIGAMPRGVPLDEVPERALPQLGAGGQ
jgi:hypothetical protein